MAMTRRRGALLGGAGVVVLAILAVVYWLRPSRPTPRHADAFDGASTELTHTVIVPTLDTPIPPGKSAIWCASCQIAWDQMRGVVGEPIRLDGAEEVADRLNRSAFPAAD